MWQRRTPVTRKVQLAVETLESRELLAAPVINNIAGTNLPASVAVQVPINKHLHVSLAGSDADGDAITYSATSSDTNFTVEVRPNTNSYLQLTVQQEPAGGGTPTQLGTMTFQLFNDLAPNTVNKLKGLVNQEFFDSLIFHRVIAGFVIQGGDPDGTGSGGPPGPGADEATKAQFQIDDEFNTKSIFAGNGQLAMAKAGEDTNGSQFFVTSGQQRGLDFQHTIWGQLVRGYDVLSTINSTQTGAGDRPTNAVRITRAEIIQNTTDAVLTVRGSSTTSAVSTITVTATDSNGENSTQTLQVTAIADTTNDPAFLNNAGLPNRTTPINTPITFTPTATTIDTGTPTFTVTESKTLPTDPSRATVTPNGDGSFTITPNTGFTGQIRFLVSATDATATTPAKDDTQLFTLAVGDANFNTVAGTPVTTTEGVSESIQDVATFRFDDVNVPASEFTARINWGDTQITNGTITVQGTGASRTFTVSSASAHAYREAGIYPVEVTITHNIGGTTAGAVTKVSTTATVRDAQLTATAGTALTGTANTALSNVLIATLNDAGTNLAAGDYVANINWGDGQTSVGTVTAAGTGFEIRGSHTYSTAGTFTANVNVRDADTSADVAASTVVASLTATISADTTTPPTEPPTPPAPTPEIPLNTPNERYIGLLYQQLLGRTVDLTGLAVHLNVFAQGLTHEVIVRGLLASPEYRNRIVGLEYQAVLGREPDAEGLAVHTAFLARGGTRAQLRGYLLGSNEYFENGDANPTAYVNRLFNDLFDRSPPELDRDSLVQRITDQKSREYIALQLTRSLESNLGFVNELYRTALRRTPEGEIANNTARNMRYQGLTENQVLVKVFTSPEFLLQT